MKLSQGKSLTWRFLVRTSAANLGDSHCLALGACILSVIWLCLLALSPPLNPAGPDALFNLQPNLTKSSNTQHSLMGLTLVVAGYILVISFLSFMNALWLMPELGHCSGWRLHHENDGISHRPTPPRVSLDIPQALDTAAVQASSPSSAHEVYCCFPNMAQPTLLV